MDEEDQRYVRDMDRALLLSRQDAGQGKCGPHGVWTRVANGRYVRNNDREDSEGLPDLDESTQSESSAEEAI